MNYVWFQAAAVADHGRRSPTPSHIISSITHDHTPSHVQIIAKKPSVTPPILHDTSRTNSESSRTFHGGAEYAGCPHDKDLHICTHVRRRNTAFIQFWIKDKEWAPPQHILLFLRASCLSRRASYCVVRTHVNRRPWLSMILGEILTFFRSFKVFHNLILIKF